MKVILMVFTKKCLFGASGPFWARKYGSGLALRVFFKFCTMKGANRYLEIILTYFKKNSSFEQMIQNDTSSQLWSGQERHGKNNERGQERHGNYINIFSLKNLIQSNLVILGQKWHVPTLDLFSVFS